MRREGRRTTWFPYLKQTVSMSSTGICGTNAWPMAYRIAGRDKTVNEVYEEEKAI
jgi:hypothetical protein